MARRRGAGLPPLSSCSLTTYRLAGFTDRNGPETVGSAPPGGILETDFPGIGVDECSWAKAIGGFQVLVCLIPAMEDLGVVPRLEQFGRRRTYRELDIRMQSGSPSSVKNEPPLCGRRVEGFGQAAKPDAPHPQVFDGLDQLLHRTRQTVELPYDQRVAAAREFEGMQGWPIRNCSRHLLGENLFAACFGQCVALQVGGRDQFPAICRNQNKETKGTTGNRSSLTRRVSWLPMRLAIGLCVSATESTYGNALYPPPAPFDLELAPSGNMGCHQRFEQTTVSWDAKMQQLVDYHEILKSHFLFGQVLREGYRASGRAGTPFPRHTLHANSPRFGFQTLRPVLDSLMEAITSVITRLHQTRRREE
jgi:hypothetical protein